MSIENDDLKEMGIDKLGHRIRILREIRRLCTINQEVEGDVTAYI